MLYELRVYDIVPGQMDRQLQTFEKDVLPLFARHSIKVVGFWQTTNQDSQQLIYICEFESQEHLEDAWKRFREAPEWLEARAARDKEGPAVAKITSTLMTQVDFSNK